MLAGGRIRAAGTIDELRAKAAGDARYIVQTNTASAQKALAEIAAVATVQSKMLDDGWHRLTVVARADSSDLRETISRTITSVGGIVRELHRDTPSLEQLFMRMIGDADGSATQSPRGNGS